MARKYKRCLGCGADVSPLAQRCDRCGSALSAVPLEMGDYVCEKCEASLPGGSRFCPACGFAFEQAVPVPEGVPLSSGFRPAVPLVPPASPVAAPTPPPSPAPAVQPAPSVPPAQPSAPKQTPPGLVIGGLLALFVLGFGLSRMMPPSANSAAPVSAPSAAVTPAPLPAPSEPAPAPSQDISSSDTPAGDTPPEKSTLDMALPAHTKHPAKPDTDDADTLSAYAPPGSGLNDVPLDISALRDTVIAPNDLKHKSLRALSLSHNSLFALHGYVFERASMKSYFEAQPWYHPNASFSMSDLSAIEQQNAQTIRVAERSQYGYGRATFDAQGQPYQPNSQQRDPLTETAAPGSGQNDQMMDLDTLQHRLVTPEDLAGKSLAGLSLSYNAIYAAHGYVFQRATFRHAFESTRWYRPNPAFQESDLDSTERANLKTIRAYERTRYAY